MSFSLFSSRTRFWFVWSRCRVGRSSTQLPTSWQWALKKYVKLLPPSRFQFRKSQNRQSFVCTTFFCFSSHKFSVWAWNMWNPCDGAAIIFFLIGLALRLQPNSMDIGRVIYCVDSIYWYLRILNILGVNKYLGKRWCINLVCAHTFFLLRWMWRMYN